MADEKEEKDEQEEKKETEDKGKDAGNKDEGKEAKPGKSGSSSMIDEAKKTAERIEKGTADLKEQLDRQEKLIAENALGGRAGMSAPEKPKTEDEKWAEDAKKRYEGTGMDPTE